MEIDYREKARAARRKILEMIWRGKTSHIGSCFSVVDILTVLYENLKAEDRVVLSPGWKAAALYYFLAEQGTIPREDLDRFPNEPYLGLSETNVKGVFCNGGSAGHGASIAAGMALGKKLSNSPGTVYCILSDGELNEGSVWEATLFAAHHNLPLVFIIDNNGWQAFGKTEEVLYLNAARLFGAYGWGVTQVDGHNYARLEQAFRGEGLRAIICDTVKGKGVSFMENANEFHYQQVTDEIYERALKEL